MGRIRGGVRDQGVEMGRIRDQVAEMGRLRYVRWEELDLEVRG